jgi:hypothetical protein
MKEARTEAALLEDLIWNSIRPTGNLDRPVFGVPAQPECMASLYPAEQSSRAMTAQA